MGNENGGLEKTSARVLREVVSIQRKGIIIATPAGDQGDVEGGLPGQLPREAEGARSACRPGVAVARRAHGERPHW